MPRAIINNTAMSVVLSVRNRCHVYGVDCINRNAVSMDMRRIFKYSAIKMKANSGPAYSVLNPETNSLSPSAKSNGLRFVSARVVANHTVASIGEMRKRLVNEREEMRYVLNLKSRMRAEIKIRAMLIS